MNPKIRWLLWCCLSLALVWPAGLTVHGADAPPLNDEELDQMLAPIALYPDSLLSQVLMASTYPADVADAAKWVKANPDLKGDDAVKKVVADDKGKDWDPSVQSLAAFPQVLTMMGDKPDQVQRIGDAFLADPGRMLDRVQFLRKKAQEAGNLKSGEQQNVSTQTDGGKTVVVIEPAQPTVVYVPVYQPTVVYGTWWWQPYPPYYWPPPPYYYPGVAFTFGFVWGASIGGVHNSMWGGCNWSHNEVNINVNKHNSLHVNHQVNNNTFVHNSERRRDVPYRDAKSREKYGRTSAGVQDRQAYRGKDGRDADRERAAQAMQQRGADPQAGRERLQGADHDRAAQAVSRGPSGGDNAFTGAGRPDVSRAAADRGRTSTQSMQQHAQARPSGGGMHRR